MERTDILYLGNNSYAVEEFAADSGYSIRTISEDEIDLNNATGIILQAAPPLIIINIKNVVNEEEEMLRILASWILNLGEGATHLVVHADGFNPDSNILASLKRGGIEGVFGYTNNQGAARAELEEIFSALKIRPSKAPDGAPNFAGASAASPPPEKSRPQSGQIVINTQTGQVSKMPPPQTASAASSAQGAADSQTLTTKRAVVTEQERNRLNEQERLRRAEMEKGIAEQMKDENLYPPEIANKKHIAVVGCTNRIGTTTVCIQLAKYLLGEGKSACYIERNKSGWAGLLDRYFKDCMVDTQKSLTVCRSVDVYSDANKISLVGDYAFYIHDFGAYEPDMDMSSVLEKDIIIAVLGFEPNEQTAAKNLFEPLSSHKNTYFICNFIHQASRSEVLELMEDLAGRTFFMEYAPDPFIYAKDMDAAFSNISESKVNNQVKLHKKVWFRR